MEFISLQDIALIAALASISGLVSRWLKLPEVLGYMLVGILVTAYLPSAHLSSLLEIFADVGLTLVLFMIGLEADLTELKKVPKSVFILPFVQLVIAFVVLYSFATMTKLDNATSLVLPLAFIFGSSAISFRYLSSKRQLSTLHGRVCSSILIFQDILAIIALALLSQYAISLSFSIASLLSLIFKLIFLISISIVFAKYIFPYIFSKFKVHEELITILGFSYALGIAGFVSSDFFSLTASIGGLIAGITLSQTFRNIQILNNLRPLKDVFLVFFFTYVGTLINIESLSDRLPLTLLVSIISAFIMPLTVFFILKKAIGSSRVALTSAIILSQVSEFSFILLTKAAGYKIISGDIFSAFCVGFLISLVFTSICLENLDATYDFIKKVFNFKSTKTLTQLEKSGHVVLIGAGRKGKHFLNESGLIDLVVIDHDPEVKSYLPQDAEFINGDCLDQDIIEASSLQNAKLVISTIKYFPIDSQLIKFLKSNNSKVKIIAFSKGLHTASKLYEFGCDLVILPEWEGSMKLLEATEVLTKESTQTENYLKKNEKAFKKILEAEA